MAYSETGVQRQALHADARHLFFLWIYGRLSFDAPNEAGPYQIPLIENRLVAHETSAAENYNDEVVGEFISYRFTNSTHQLWSLWCGNEKVLGELDLQRYFTRTTDMDYNVEQEFHLLVIVEEDQIIVTEISGDDWEEGGIIG